MTRVNLTRRQFFGYSALAASCAAGNGARAQEKAQAPNDLSYAQYSYCSDGQTAKIFSSAIAEPVTILQISDSHLFLDDERGDEFKQYSDRMAKAYNHTKRFSDGKETNPTEMFEEIAARAKSQNYDAVALTGDIVSFPSAAGVDFVKEKLDATEIPYFYVCGNHDWHFEGMEGTEKDLRDEWIEKRLKPLFPEGVNPLGYSRVVKGVNILMIDDSIYEILPEQLEFLRAELAKGLPTLAFMHIPLYAPGRGVGFGVGHPEWNAAHDRNYKIERRLQWPEEGHTAVTYAFRDEIINAPNVLGVFTGHIHGTSLDLLNGRPSNVVRAAVDGSTLRIEIQPFPKRPAPRQTPTK